MVPLGDELVSSGLLTVREDGTLVIPEDVLRAAKICPGASVGFSINEDGELIVGERDPDQWWFWTEEFLEGTHRAKMELREGGGTVYWSDEEFRDALLERMKDSSADV